MPRAHADVLQGTLTLLILRTLAREPLHGYGITQRIHALSAELLRVEEGSLYPALHRLEQQGWIASAWRRTEAGRRARFYELTRAGRRELEAEQASWKRLTRGVARVLRHA